MEIQVDFLNPNEITKDALSPDDIVVIIKDDSLFIDFKDFLTIPV